MRERLRSFGFSLSLEDMEPHIRAWDRWMRAHGDFCDYRDTDGVGRVYEVHRRSIHPAMRVCREWGSLLLNDRTQVACAEQACTDWLAVWMARMGFLASAQECVVRAFGLGTGAWALWVDAGAGEVRVRRYDARMVVPFTWDEEGVTECAFVTRAFWRGRAVDQMQMHLKGTDGTFFSPGESSGGASAASSSRLADDSDEGTYRIAMACFDRDGNRVELEGVCPVYDTGSPWPTFALVKPAIDSTRVDMSPYGQSVFADAVDAIQAVDLCYDAMMSEIDNGKMRVFLSDVMFDTERDGKGGRLHPLRQGGLHGVPEGHEHGGHDPRVRADAAHRGAGAGVQGRAADARRPVRLRHQLLRPRERRVREDGHGGVGGQLGADAQHSSPRACAQGRDRGHLSGAARGGAGTWRRAADEGGIRMGFDDSIITDTTAEKRQDMDEVAAGLMEGWEYRAKWYGEDEATARCRGAAAGSGASDDGSERVEAAQAGVPGRGRRREKKTTAVPAR